MPFSPNAESVFADGATLSPLNPYKPDIRAWGRQIEAATDAIASGAGTIAKQTLEQLNADLVHGADTMAWVYADPSVASNGIYRKNGASGSGFWTLMLPLPYTYIAASNTGTGTANAIKATSSLPVTNGILVSVNIGLTNTVSPVTIAFNSQSALTIKTRSGQDVAPGDLTPGYILGLRLDSIFYLLSDTAVASLIYAARDAAFAARDAAIVAQGLSEDAQHASEAARDIAAGYASDAVSQGNVPIYATIDGLVALPGGSPGVPVGINAIRVNGKSSAGDKKGGDFVDTDNGSLESFVSGGATSRRWYRSTFDISLQPAASTFAEAKRYTSGISITEFPDINWDGNITFDSAPGFSEMCSKVSSNGGGTIDIFPGADICFAQPAFVYHGVYLRGGGGRMLNLDNGAFGTRIRPTANMTALITQENIANLIHSVGVEGINFDGRKGDGFSVSHLIYLSPVNSHFERNTLQNASGDGMYLPTNSVAAWVNWIAYNHIAYNGGWGARLEITDSDFCNNYVSNNGDQATNVAGGIWIHAYGNVRVISNQIELCDVGILENSIDAGANAIMGQSIMGNFLDHLNVGIYVKKGTFGTDVVNTSSYIGNKFNVTTDCGIKIDDHIKGGTIVGNNFMGQQSPGVKNIRFVTGANNPGWSIIGNAFSNPGPTGFDIENPPADVIALNSGNNPYVRLPSLGWRGTTATTVGAAGAAQVLPSNPVGYMVIDVAGFTRKIPYYQ